MESEKGQESINQQKLEKFMKGNTQIISKKDTVYTDGRIKVSIKVNGRMV